MRQLTNAERKVISGDFTNDGYHINLERDMDRNIVSRINNVEHPSMASFKNTLEGVLPNKKYIPFVSTLLMQGGLPSIIPQLLNTATIEHNEGGGKFSGSPLDTDDENVAFSYDTYSEIDIKDNKVTIKCHVLQEMSNTQYSDIGKKIFVKDRSFVFEFPVSQDASNLDDDGAPKNFTVTLLDDDGSKIPEFNLFSERILNVE